MAFVQPTRKNDLAITAILAAVLILLLVLKVDRVTIDNPRFAAGGDHLAYHAMASDKPGSFPAPYCFRVLVPGLVKSLPLSTETGFFLQTLFFLWSSGLILFLVLRELGESRFFAWSGLALFLGLNWAGKFTVWNFWLTDPALFFFGIAAFYATVRNNLAAFILAITLGVLAKEAILFTLPLYYGYHARKFLDWRLAGKTILAGLLPLGLVLAMRTFIPASNQYDLPELFREIGLPWLTRDIVGNILGGTTGTWGVPVFLLAILGFLQEPRLRRAAVFFLPFVYLQPMFANNLDRLLVFGFVIVIPLAVAGLRWFSTRYQLAPWMTIGYVALPFLFLLLKTGYLPASREQQLIGLAVWSIVVFMVRRRKSGPAPKFS